MKVYQLYKDILYNTSCRIVKNEHDAQDVVQDAFIKAFQNISKLDNDLNLGAWLKRITINQSFDFLRQKKRLGWLQNVEDVQISEQETEELVDFPLNAKDVKQAINALKEKYRIVLVLYLIEDYTHKEIAEQLSLKEGTVRNQYIRGKQLLKQKLQSKLVV
ncbi:RNA polymerase sigma factor [Winogradskyella immobilis]|uniref:RNA polymerase sigma factor n=1 Tax=Winogradskyella immobilis TaxID=2816852 RepID=A0ABS8EJD2_9FLAO|nr:RNA polymerase sigma factor [Winogradskyella immobilis]MCC1483152.1 RNA polymerase sigma factor [Winogradskyella immobilis]MCG0015247.1 RNA polymerase sigma factor [Winogradskyella immobilis]